MRRTLMLLLTLPTVLAWNASDGPVTVHVDEQTFAYHIDLAGRTWFTSGIVSLICAGKAYSSETGLVGDAITTTEDVHARSIQRSWSAGICGTITTAVRAYASGGIEFLTTAGSDGLNGTVTCAKPGPSCPSTATGFPNLLLPAGAGYASWCAEGCGGSNTLHLGTPVVPPPADWLQYGGGGPQGGPLVTYAEANGSASVLGPSRRFKVPYPRLPPYAPNVDGPGLLSDRWA